MADKSAFVPVDAMGGGGGKDDIDIDEELFGKKANAMKPKETPPTVAPAPSPAKSAAPPKKFEYKKATSYTKITAGATKK
ncbi:hypothetical protein WR25_04405 [Diploscapter pachys]|uniref:Uncharacterized protein n=1 Tax=Diploscapter pachys TaxID=2018661 RepID=A0A2A2J869_9BILA|nr:hypothetical protein WR25_04405 [Diploscapter pachys]